ncbi:LysR family transcriptional regulator [Rhizobium sp. ICMP 5592]|uniref:LysR family transcriptional regulator n=1 Tax=Rhizobium sp. ICMP 5592 TaxID=2292445 RepID=UPI001294ACF0|nr:LysR family transcriptional regulator [Rhizobium sp. ICMP 5592]MQB41013.1 LysR family transcriptional regulator [Rhizobium sp. ICMP 5592]
MDALTLDQIYIFLAVVDEGSFSKAAKKLNRAQSAVTYGIQKLEAQIDVPLFDRAAYRATLTEAGRALLLRARRIAEEANAFRDSAKGLTSGLEAELAIVLDSMFPMPPLATALQEFTERFPTVTPRVYVQPLGAAAELLLDGTCAIGLLQLLFAEMPTLKRFPLLTIDLIPVVAPNHPLAEFDRPIETHELQRYVQLVLTDRSSMTAGRDYGVLSGQTWRLADLGAKHSMLLSGLGWGNMPSHLVEDDIKRGRLKIICPADFDARVVHLAMGGAYRADQRLGPAGQWMVEYLSTVSKP